MLLGVYGGGSGGVREKAAELARLTELAEIDSREIEG
jgi:hypothetical protein